MRPIPGELYGRWLVVDVPPSGKFITARCSCGTERRVSIGNVSNGRSTSCGCRRKESLASRNGTHGLTDHPLYSTWLRMRYRCTKPWDKKFRDYGGRGIKVCAQWAAFESFVADMGDRPEGFSLERIDVNGDYEPGNCCWADATAQAFNRRIIHPERRMLGVRLAPKTLEVLTGGAS